MHPLITIVTVCFNSEKTIARTIDSVLNQDISEVEYLIVDGASTDNTLYIIDRYKNRFQEKLKVISEPDNGWYDAMNKGILNAKGKFIVFLNSDDFFDKDAISNVVKFIQKNSINPDAIVYGDSTNIYQNSKGEIFYKKIDAPNYLNKSNRGLRDGMCGIRHQSMFTGKQVFKNVGLFCLKYYLHADWDFLIRCVNKGIHMEHLPENLTFYSMYGASSRPNHTERHQLRKDNGLYHWVDLNYIKDRWGIKIIAKKMLGEKYWNDLLFYFHKKKSSN